MLKIDKLNSYAKEILSGNLLDTYKPFSGNLNEATQILPKNVEAYNLNTLVSGLTQDVYSRFVCEKDTQAIIRFPVGYALALDMQDNKNLFNYHMMNLVNLALTSFTYKCGNLDNKMVVCERPGSFDEFFRHVENVAAIELRFVLMDKV